jgi:hypothetical protein
MFWSDPTMRNVSEAEVADDNPSISFVLSAARIAFWTVIQARPSSFFQRRRKANVPVGSPVRGASQKNGLLMVPCITVWAS